MTNDGPLTVQISYFVPWYLHLLICLVGYIHEVGQSYKCERHRLIEWSNHTIGADGWLIGYITDTVADQELDFSMLWCFLSLSLSLCLKSWRNDVSHLSISGLNSIFKE